MRFISDPSPPVSRKFLGWIVPTIRISEEFYINNVGLDAVMYLRFLKMCLQFCIFNGFVVGIILLPIHYTAGGKQTEVPRLSISNVPTNSNLLWAHVFLTYLITISWMFLLFKNYWQWMDLRREYTLQRIRQGEIAERSIFISRLPSNLRSDAALRQYFESLKMGPVESATVVQHCGRLSQNIDRRESTLNRLEAAHIELARSFLENAKAGRASVNSTDSNTEALSDKSLTVSNAAATLDNATLRQIAQDLYKDKKLYTKYRKSIFAKKRETVRQSADLIDKETTAAKQVLDQGASANQVACRSEIIDIQGDQEPESDAAACSPTFTIWHILATCNRQSLDAFQPTRSEKRFKGGSRVDCINYFVKKYNRLDKKVEELRDGSLRFKSTSFGFVTFKHHLSAQLCAQSKIDSRPQGLSVYLAMEPRDVLWSNLTASFRNRFTRSVAVNLSIWVITIFWIFPTSSFLLLTSLSALSERFHFLRPILDASPLIQSLLQNVLPIVFVTIFLALAPVIILAISKQELPVSHSELEGKVLRRYYHFLIFNVLFVFMIGTAILKSIIELIQAPTNIFTMLAKVLPSGSTFFVFYIVFNTCTHFLELLQVWAQLVIHIIVTARKFTRTPRSLQRATTPWCFQYYYYYPQNILAFVITLIYSIISPLILLAAIFFFGTALVIFKYQLAYCYVRKYENSGRYFRHVFQYTSDGLIIFQLTMMGVLWLNEALVGGFFIVALLGFTIYFKVLCGDLFRSRTKFLPLDTGLRNFDGAESVHADPEQDLYAASSISTQSGEFTSGLRRRQTGANAKAAEASIHTVSSASQDDHGMSNGSATSLGQPKTFSRLRVTAGYKKLVQSESTEDIPKEQQADRPVSDAVEGGAADDKEELRQSVDHHGTPSNDIDPSSYTEAADENKVEQRSGESEDTVPPSTLVVPEETATYGDGFLSGDGYFIDSMGPPPVHPYPSTASHFEHTSSKLVYQDRISEFETYMHPALLRPLNRKMWLPKNPLYEHWDLDDTIEIDFALNSSPTSGKVQFRAQATDGVMQSPRIDHERQPQRRDTSGSNFDGATDAPVSSSNWQGCLADSNSGPGASQWADKENSAHDEPAYTGASRIGTDMSEGPNATSAAKPSRPPLMQCTSMASAPEPSTASIHASLAEFSRQGLPIRRRQSLPSETVATASQSPLASPLSMNPAPTRAIEFQGSRPSQRPTLSPQVPGAPPARATTFGATLPSRYSVAVHPQNIYSSSGINTVSGNSIRKTEPKTTRGFFNMLFGNYGDEDLQDDDEPESQRFGYETSGIWRRRRGAPDDDDDDDDEEADSDRASDRHQAGTDSAADRAVAAAAGEGHDAIGLEELQLEQPSHLDLSESLTVPNNEGHRSGSFVQRTMNFLREPEKQQ
ncbi:hypothetical protein BC939DRAFT_267215 [Gamsiella multidivaricata]|uniref:uncharacterized protein n=1 Tax=Gamsiella multidivaricata TaxID=101098 RepID=UPI002220A5F9|nr:uncharacterized protein BC939DRAFT_267215 [Gamsiella multidivaricata]KAI7819350.1 hypothetical protein BC939DRAFT_267215 [Gamsiella multidivaricata]